MHCTRDKRFAFSRVGIAGLGLIGASLAKAIKSKTCCTVLGYDRDEGVLSRALCDGTIDALADEHSLAKIDLLLVALYPADTIDYVHRHAPHLRKGCIVLDLCGVKRAVAGELTALAKEHGFVYVGAHPMAGCERSGYDAASDALFSGASLIVTDIPESLCAPLWAFFHALGFSHLQKSSPEEHDRIIAYTSQLAHVVASAYVKSPTALSHQGFSAGSFSDMTRVAYLQPAMWTELFSDNAQYLACEIDALCDRLKEYTDAIRNHQHERLYALLLEGRERKEALEGKTQI